jgi:hypothetical protein
MTNPAPPPQPYRNGNGSRMGIVERLATIITSLTLQNVLVMGILVVLAIPAYAVWQLLHDSDLRKEVLSFAKEQDMNVPCQVVTYSFAGQNEKTTVISGVGPFGVWEIVVGTRSPGMMTAKEAAEACTVMRKVSANVRDALQREDAQTK